MTTRTKTNGVQSFPIKDTKGQIGQTQDIERIKVKLTFSIISDSVLDAWDRIIDGEVELSKTTVEQLRQRPQDFIKIMGQHEPELMEKIQEFDYLENAHTLKLDGPFWSIRFALGIEVVEPKDMPLLRKKLHRIAGKDCICDDWMKDLMEGKRTVVVGYNKRPIGDFVLVKMRDGDVFLPVQVYPPDADTKVNVTSYAIKGAATGTLIVGMKGIQLDCTQPSEFGIGIARGAITQYSKSGISVSSKSGLRDSSEKKILELFSKLLRKEAASYALASILEEASVLDDLARLLRSGRATLSGGEEETVERGKVPGLV